MKHWILQKYATKAWVRSYEWNIIVIKNIYKKKEDKDIEVSDYIECTVSVKEVREVFKEREYKEEC